MNWIAWITSWLTFWVSPLGRRDRENLVTILLENPIEFRVALLVHQIRNWT